MQWWRGTILLALKFITNYKRPVTRLSIFDPTYDFDRNEVGEQRLGQAGQVRKEQRPFLNVTNQKKPFIKLIFLLFCSTCYKS